MLKFHDDPTVDESEIIIFLRQILWYAKKKKEGFGKKRRKNEIKKERRRTEYRQFENKTNLRCLYL